MTELDKEKEKMLLEQRKVKALEKFLKDVKRLFKPKDKYLMASERHNIPLE